MSSWKEIPDDKVRLIWECTCKNCNCPWDEWIEVSPTFFQDNGTPQCECGCDMDYVKTEIKED